MSRLPPPLLALLVAAAAPALAQDPSVAAPEPPMARASSEPAVPARAQPRDFAGELAACRSISALAGLTVTGWEVRVGLGGRQGKVAATAMRLPWFDSLTWLVSAGLSRGRTPAGLEVRGLQLGLGLRAQRSRFTVGIDSHWVQLEVPRVSTGGAIRAAGARVGLLGAFDLLRLGEQGAFMAFIDGTGELYGASIFGDSGQHNSQFAAHGGLALRW